jgi:hypothetical protein
MIKRLIVKAVRSICDESFPLPSLAALIWKNDAGKSVYARMDAA